MHLPTVQNLLRMREKNSSHILTIATAFPTLLLICDSYPELFEIKKNKIKNQQNPRLQLEVIEDSAHQIFVDQPGAVAQQVAQFLSQSKA